MFYRQRFVVVNLYGNDQITNRICPQNPFEPSVAFCLGINPFNDLILG